MVWKILKRFWVSATVCAVGVTLVSIGLPESQWLTVPTARWLTIGGVVFLVIAIILFIHEVKKPQNGDNRTQSTKTKNKESYIPELLGKMHRRLMQLAEERAREEFNTEKFNTANELIIDSTGIIKLGEQEDVMAEIKEKLGIKRLPKTKKSQKKLSKKLLRLAKEYKFESTNKKWDLSDLIKIGENLDGQKIGVGDLRDRDKRKWLRWYKELNTEKEKYNDDELNNLIAKNIFVSYGCCSEWLYTAYILKMDNEYTEAPVSLVRGATANMLINIDKAMEEHTLPIMKRISELRGTQETTKIQ